MVSYREELRRRYIDPDSRGVQLEEWLDILVRGDLTHKMVMELVRDRDDAVREIKELRAKCNENDPDKPVRYVYSFVVGLDPMKKVHVSTWKACDNLIRIDLSFTEKEFEQYARELKEDGLILHEVERWVETKIESVKMGEIEPKNVESIHPTTPLFYYQQSFDLMMKVIPDRYSYFDYNGQRIFKINNRGSNRKFQIAFDMKTGNLVWDDVEFMGE